MDRNQQIGVPWSDLPKELLDKIAKCLDTEIDALRFRAVCSSWRSSTTSFKKFSCETVKLPFPFDHRIPRTEFGFSELEDVYFSLVEIIVYRIELPDPKQEEPNFWLVKTTQLSDGRLRILNPLSHCPVNIPPETQMPKVLNTLDFRVSEVCKAYSLKCVNSSKVNKDYGCAYAYAKKVIISAGKKSDDYVVMAIDNYKNVWYTKLGDEKWTAYPGHIRFHDVVFHKGMFHGIDRQRGTWVFDLNFESRKVGYNKHEKVLKRHLVELYNSELLLVEVVVYKQYLRTGDRCPQRVSRKHEVKVDIISYAWDTHEEKWVEKNLGNDWIIVVCDDCSYAVSTKGCKETCVFYQRWLRSFCLCSDLCVSYDDKTELGNFVASDEVELKFRGFHGDKVGVYNYQSGKMGPVLIFPEYADVFWPPPSWLYRT